MLAVKLTESARYGNEAVVGAASEAFARWLHHRYAPVELPSAGTYRFSARYHVRLNLRLRCKTEIPRERFPRSILVTSSQGCPQGVVRIVLVEFRERHDTRTNGQHYTAADRPIKYQGCATRGGNPPGGGIEGFQAGNLGHRLSDPNRLEFGPPVGSDSTQ